MEGGSEPKNCGWWVEREAACRKNAVGGLRGPQKPKNRGWRVGKGHRGNPRVALPFCGEEKPGTKPQVSALLPLLQRLSLQQKWPLCREFQPAKRSFSAFKDLSTRQPSFFGTGKGAFNESPISKGCRELTLYGGWTRHRLCDSYERRAHDCEQQRMPLCICWKQWLCAKASRQRRCTRSCPDTLSRVRCRCPHRTR